MTDKHKEQVREYYAGLVPIQWAGGVHENPESLVMQIPEMAFGQIPDEDVCVAHMNSYHREQARAAQVFITDKAIQIVHHGIFRREKLLGTERIRPETITGVERRHGGINTSAGMEWEVTISRTAEKDTLVNLSDAESQLILKTIDTWQNSSAASKSSASSDPADLLIKLKGLLDAGVISQEEFDEKKSELMGRL